MEKIRELELNIISNHIAQNESKKSNIDSNKLYNICNKYNLCASATNTEYNELLNNTTLNNTTLNELARKLYILSDDISFEDILLILISNN